MRNVLVSLVAGWLIGAVAAAHAELPAPTAEEKAAAAAKSAKDAAAKAEAAKLLESAQDKAVANYRKRQGSSSPRATAAQTSRPDGAIAPAASPGANHAANNPPAETLTRKEAQTKMPTPGQANDHSSTARETVPSGR
jgi:hypothetical protein